MMSPVRRQLPADELDGSRRHTARCDQLAEGAAHGRQPLLDSEIGLPADVSRVMVANQNLPLRARGPGWSASG